MNLSLNGPNIKKPELAQSGALPESPDLKMARELADYLYKFISLRLPAEQRGCWISRQSDEPNHSELRVTNGGLGILMYDEIPYKVLCGRGTITVGHLLSGAPKEYVRSIAIEALEHLQIETLFPMVNLPCGTFGPVYWLTKGPKPEFLEQYFA